MSICRVAADRLRRVGMTARNTAVDALIPEGGAGFLRDLAFPA
ncbi:MAG: hypothetical protein AAB272_05505 [candidate division NC10 bacterium]